jgi:hypothetical protein
MHGKIPPCGTSVPFIYLDTAVLLPENAPMVFVISKLTRLRVGPKGTPTSMASIG